jgi:hypothetical protein
MQDTVQDLGITPGPGSYFHQGGIAKMTFCRIKFDDIFSPWKVYIILFQRRRVKVLLF